MPTFISFCLLLGLICGVSCQEVDLLSHILHRMRLLEDEKPTLDPCPYLLSKQNLTLPPFLLKEQFSKEVSSVRHLTRLLNGFLSHHLDQEKQGTLSPLSVRMQSLEQIARSAAITLLNQESRLKAVHLCWFNGEDVSASSGALPSQRASNLKCYYFAKNPAVVPSVAGSLRSTAASAQGANVLGVQSITGYQKNLIPLVDDVWPQLTKSNASQSGERAGWTAPYLDCNGTWLITYLIALSGRQDISLESSNTGAHIFRGTFGIDIDLTEHVDVNQCADLDHPDSIFANTNKCHRQSTTCNFTSRWGFRKGGYECICKPGFYSASTKFSGEEVEDAYSTGSTDRFHCLPCAPDCETCHDDGPCVVTYDIVARGFPLGALTFCITCAVFVGSAVYRYRKRKVIASATWPLLENIVMGAILIYCSVILRYFHPTFELCVAEPWLREVGFMLFYCAVILKLYKVVTEFRTRKAHCVYVRDKDLVKYHVGIILITAAFMAAWSSVTMDLHRDGQEVLLTRTLHGRHHKICRLPWWDYVAESCETLILLWGIYLSYLARNSKTLYMERKLLTAAIFVELIVSVLFYVIRHVIWYDVHPDFIYLLYFTRSQLTITVNLCVIFGGKLWYIFRPQDDPFRKNQAQGTQGRPAEMEKLHDGIFSGDLELNQIPLADMDHGEIRMELRRLYAQMQVLKTKAMRQDNPHISKKKGGRKMPHRRWDEKAEKAAKKLLRHPKYDEETTAVKTPEESSGSVENFHADAPTVFEEETYGSPLHTAAASVIKNSLLNKKGNNQHIGVTNL